MKKYTIRFRSGDVLIVDAEFCHMALEPIPGEFIEFTVDADRVAAVAADAVQWIQMEQSDA